MPRSSRLFVCLCAYDNNDVRLVDEVEGANHLISTHFEAFLAPHTGVLARAAADGIDATRWQPRELRVGVHALDAYLPSRQGERLRTLGHVGPLVWLIGGVGRDAEQVEAPDPLCSALVVERGVDDAHIAMAWSLWAKVDDFE